MVAWNQVQTRRSVLRGAALAALAGASPLRAAVPAAPMHEPFTLTRRIDRELKDGSHLVVTREWLCHFTSRNGGWIVDGAQVSCTVEAPEKLAVLAEAERNREETGLFPAYLDARGQVTNFPVQEAQDFSAVVARQLQRTPLAAPQDKAYVMALAQASAELVSQWPNDLFFPEPGLRTARETIPLASGGTGAISLTVEITIDPITSLLARREKHIVTDVAETRRTASEIWTLTRA